MSDASRSSWIIGPFMDWLWLIGSPLWALALGFLVWLIPDLRVERDMVVWPDSIAGFGLKVIIFAHLILAVFRSHLNPTVLKRYPIRFLVVPVLMFVAMVSSEWVLVIAAVLATWWDVYHSSLQTFGIGRLYELRAGLVHHPMRNADRWFNLLIYAGPILGGASLMNHMNDFHEFALVDAVFIAGIPEMVAPHTHWFTAAVVSIAGFAVPAYIEAWRKSVRAGYAVPWQKPVLYLVTAAVSVCAWGFNSFAEAYLIMNVFHAVQYYAIVIHSEGAGLRRRLRFGDHAFGKALTLLVFVVPTACYGIWAWSADIQVEYLLAITLTVSLCHFWFDGFMWSVRRGHV